MPALTKIQTGFIEPQGAFPIDTGTAAAPGLKFSDSAATGIFSPSTGALSLTTSGVERLNVDSSGNVLIKHDTLAYLNLTKNNGGGNGSLTFNGTIFAITSNSSGADMQLGTNSTPRLTIKVGGNVGIGTDNPGTKLHVEGNGNESITLRLKQGTTPGNYSSLQVGRTDGAGNQHITDAVTGGIPISGIPGILLGSSNTGVPAVSIQSANTANGHIVFSPRGSEEVRITSDGNLGINRTDPNQRLNVSGNIEVNAYDNSGGNGGYNTSGGLIIGNLYDAGKSYSGSDDRTACIWQERGLDLDFATNNTLGMKLTYDGKVSISSDGTAAGLLTIKGDSDEVSTPSIRLLDGTDTREVSITNTAGDFVVSTHGTDDAIHGKIKIFESGIIDLGTGGASGTLTSRLRITSDGKIGVNRTQPQGILHVYTDTLNADNGYNGQNFGIVVETEDGNNDGDEGNGICFTQQYSTDAIDGSKVRTGAIIGYKDQSTGNFGGGLKFKVQQFGASSLLTAMTLNKSGNVGIGTENPDHKLQVKGDISIDNESSTEPSMLHFNANNKDNLDPTSRINFWEADSHSTSYANSHAFIEYNGSTAGGDNGYLSIGGYVSTTANVDILTVSRSGRVGIGTINPTRMLHVASTGTNSLVLVTGTTPQIRLNSSATDNNDATRAIFGLATASQHFFSTAVSGDACLRTTDGGNLLFGEGTTERFRITDTGKVNVNQSGGSVGSKFNIFNGSDTDNIFGITGADESSEYAAIGIRNGAAVFTGGGSGSTSTDIIFRSSSSGTEDERLRISSGGELSISGSRGGLNVSDAILKFNIVNSNGDGKKAEIKAIKTSDISSELIFSTTSSHTFDERARINSAGNFGVGNTSPTQARLVAQTASGVTIAAVKDNTGASISLGGVTQPRVLMEAGASASEFKLYTAAGSSYGSASWTPRMIVNSDGNVGINQTSPSRSRLHVVGPSSSTTEIVSKFKGGTGTDAHAQIALVAGYSDTANDTEGHVKLGALRAGNGNAAHMTFSIYDGSSMAEKWRIATNGSLQKIESGNSFQFMRYRFSMPSLTSNTWNTVFYTTYKANENYVNDCGLYILAFGRFEQSNTGGSQWSVTYVSDPVYLHCANGNDGETHTIDLNWQGHAQNNSGAQCRLVFGSPHLPGYIQFQPGGWSYSPGSTYAYAFKIANL